MMNESEEKAKAAYLGRSGEKSDSTVHQFCLKKLQHAVKKSPHVKFMLDAMKKAGCDVCVEKDIFCEPCGPTVAGGYDETKKQIVLCENNIYFQFQANAILSHELVHSYDHCRAHIDWNDMKHLACSEIRAANLSGECYFWKETFLRFRFGWKKHQQACVRYRAAQSLTCVKDISEEQAYQVVDEVFPNCFADTDPFEQIPP